MRAGGSKAKGGSFERKICVLLSLWISKGKNQDLFWRSAMSGGRATRGLSKGVTLNRQAGDICAIAPEGHKLTDKFYFELKHYKNLRLDQFVFGEGPLMKLWLHTKKEAAKYNREPVMIVNTARLPIMLITITDSFLFDNNICDDAVWTYHAHIYKLDDMLKTRFDG